MDDRHTNEQALQEENRRLRLRVAELEHALLPQGQSDASVRDVANQLMEIQRVAHLGLYTLDIPRGRWTSSAILDEIFGIGGLAFERDTEGWLQIVHPDEREAMRRYFQEEVLGCREAFNREYRIVRLADQEERWVHGLGELRFDDAGRPVQLIGTIQDITERKRTEAALRQSEERLRLALDASNMGVWEWDVRTDRAFWSPECFEIVGVDRMDLNPEAVRALIHPEDFDRAVTAAHEAIAEGSMFFEDLRILRPDGEVRWVSNRGQATYDEEGRPVRFIGTVQDVTERKVAEQEKDALRAQLHHSQKMESIGRLAGGVAHDFNNMLSVIIGNAEMALEQVEPSDLAYRDLQEIRMAAERSTELTRRLLAFARRQTISPRILDLNETVSGMLKMLRRLIGEDIDLLWQPGNELWKVNVDPSQVDQLLANLAVNARDAIDGTGTVTLQTQNVSLDTLPQQEAPEFRGGDYVLLTFSDSGRGMTPEVMSHLFEPFFTTKEVGRGTGLGLATVYGIVKQNNGYIYATSQPNQGATFRIYLPRVASDREAEAASAAKDAPRGGRETILLVEDDEPILNLAARILRKLGYTVLGASVPREALRLAEEHEGAINLLLTDVVMPGMNGRDLSERLRGIRPDMRILFISGYSADVLARRGVLEEGIRLVQKPFTVKSLSEAVRQALDGLPV